ncbi:MAG: BadF/BadG/BcrA/BcrD ATPase family protein [Myxococcota bacterium]
MSRLVLGVDGGGTKTQALVADEAGRILGEGRAGGSNYAAAGEEAAAQALRAAIDAALASAGGSQERLAAAGLGLSGFDGPPEQAIVGRLVDRVLPGVPRFLENDSLLVLRAGTDDGVGVGLVAGTGQNCIGRDRAGRRLQIGGLGAMSGDVAGAGQLAIASLAAAYRAADGRCPPSLLSAAIPAALGVAGMGEVASRIPTGDPDDEAIRRILPVLFQSAEAGDAAALEILEGIATSLAIAARAAVLGLGLEGSDRAVILGGRTLQDPANTVLSARVLAAIARLLPGLRSRVLDVPPVTGGVLWALDLLGSDRARDRRLLEVMRYRLVT